MEKLIRFLVAQVHVNLILLDDRPDYPRFVDERLLLDDARRWYFSLPSIWPFAGLQERAVRQALKSAVERELIVCRSISKMPSYSYDTAGWNEGENVERRYRISWGTSTGFSAKYPDFVEDAKPATPKVSGD